MRHVQPVVIISPWVWLLMTFWKPIVIGVAIFTLLLTLTVMIGGPLAIQSALRKDAAVPTLYIPEMWRHSLTVAALTPTATPRVVIP